MILLLNFVRTAKPSHIFNADESGISIVHHLSKVVALIGQHNDDLMSADKGRTQY